ncbi:MAG TPA: amino acid permease, partial [Planctomycetota bacterium]
YFLISRSLGVEFGGSIGLVFFLAQAASVAMYLIGFTEAFQDAFPNVAIEPRSLASLVNAGVFLCVFIGAGWTIKVQYGILAVLIAALVSFAAGGLRDFDPVALQENLTSDYRGGATLFAMFALFFPAATGIMAGANMSGDLKEPSRSIPRGTLAAIGVTAMVYVGMALLLGGVAGREQLHQDNMIVKTVSWSPLLVTLGVFAATLSSAIGSMMGAPRILQALARDRIFKGLGYFAKGAGSSNEPRRAVALTFLIAQGGILIGDLNVIAPIITMFFIVTYGYLNLATFYEAYTRNPSYRPTFRFSHWALALLGAVGCGAAMFLISPLWATVAVAAMGVLHWSIARREVLAAWGDVRGGTAFERARRSLLKLEVETFHPKNWRPHVLALSGGAWNRVHLAVYGPTGWSPAAAC